LSHYDGADELGYQHSFGVSQSLFAKLPDDALYAAAVGLDPKLIVDGVRKKGRFTLVSIFDVPSDSLKVLSAPVNGVLDRVRHRFVIESNVFEEIMIVQGKSWIPLTKSGRVHSLSFVPTQGNCSLWGNAPSSWSLTPFWVIEFSDD